MCHFNDPGIFQEKTPDFMQNFEFVLTYIDDMLVISGEANILDPGDYTASETEQFGYEASEWTGACDADGDVTLAYGDEKTCYITNSDIQPELIVIKIVNNRGYGEAVPSDFTMLVSGTNVSPTSFPGASAPGTLVTLNAGMYEVTETADPDLLLLYGVYYSDDCEGTIAVGETKTCTVTNRFKIAAWTPGFWKTHGPGAPHGKDAWQYTDYEVGDLLDDVFELGPIAGLSVKGSLTGFADKTLLDALNFRGGGGEAGAAEILLRAAVASLLNASINDKYDIPGFFFPLTVANVIEMVNDALDSYDRSEMLALAGMLDDLNNGDWEFPFWYFE